MDLNISKKKKKKEKKNFQHLKIFAELRILSFTLHHESAESAES